ncbi:chitinase [Streptomyces sp. NBC_00102]|uniref:chitinase n=1 Tax=Streptomyces sp. NBC_00102 TaxID=2975652 RepID=UPI0022532EDF|nr:chitinase [Streptomyces sp. NBC_00102]MCX5401271.1 chitinase [Streptomyces sp. NBC_00102]
MRGPSKRAAALAGPVALALACGGCATGTVADQSDNAPVPPSSSAKAADSPAYTPYVSATTASDTDGAGSPDTYNLAFVVADGGCTPSWGGSAAADDAAVRARVSALTASGADVRVSFGGAAGTELALACDSAQDLADAYAKVLDAVGADRADFDIEGDTLTDRASVVRRDRAIRLLQKSRDLDVTYTLPVMPDGLDASGLTLLEDAVTEGVELSAVNVMAMNYSESHDGDMGQYAQQAARAAHTQLAEALDLDSAGAWKALHLTVMAGVNDVAGETFTLADASGLRTFAEKQGVGALSLWSTFRDRACAEGEATVADDSCSGVEQEDGAFGAALGGG